MCVDFEICRINYSHLWPLWSSGTVLALANGGPRFGYYVRQIKCVFS